MIEQLASLIPPIPPSYALAAVIVALVVGFLAGVLSASHPPSDE